MIQVDNIQVFNFNGAFHGLRNPMNSWDKSDSNYSSDIVWTEENKIKYNFNKVISYDYVIGPNDLKLAQRMIGGGTEESKFMRQIFVTMDINAMLAWWKEMDTYKIGTTANSCSTMHKLTSEEITAKNFSFDDEVLKGISKDYNLDTLYHLVAIRDRIVEECEELRQQYLKTKDKRLWRMLIEILPSAYMQKRTWTANYQVLRNIYFQRRNHKLQEWRDFCGVIENLPYGKELICYEKKE